MSAEKVLREALALPPEDREQMRTELDRSLAPSYEEFKSRTRALFPQQ